MKPENPAIDNSPDTSPPQVSNEKKAPGIADKQEAKLNLEIQNLEIKNRREGRRQWTPIIATALYNTTGSSAPITAYGATLALVSWLSVLAMSETYRRTLR